MVFRCLTGCILFICLLVQSRHLYAQEDTLQVLFSKETVQPGDTVDIDFTLLSAKTKLNKATVHCIVRNSNQFERRFRWPLINKTGVVQLYIDPEFPNGIYDFLFFVQEGIFQVNGSVLNPPRQQALKAVLMNSKGQISIEEVKVFDNGKFVFKNYIFENYANLFFSRVKGSVNGLDILISTLLDSAYSPVAVAGTRLKVGKGGSGVFSPELKMTKTDSFSYRSSEYLEEVFVYGAKRNAIEFYESNYVGGIFRDLDSKTFSLIDDPQVQSSLDILEYVQNKIPNIRISYNQNGEPIVAMRNVAVQFYLDEIPLDVSYLRSVSLTDIALVKVFQPPFIGNLGGAGGAIAVYTRRGGDVVSKSGGNYRFRVKGYTPAFSVLSTKHL